MNLMRISKPKILFIIFVAALSLRLFTVITQEEVKRIPRSDAANYDYIAMNVVSGEGFSEVINGEILPTARRTPAFPLFLAGIYAVFGHSYMAVKIIQAILGALLCITIFFIAYSLSNNKAIGILSAVMMAAYKPFVSGFHYYGGPAILLSEYLYMFLIGLVILNLSLFLKTENKKFGILTGFFIGLAILTRPGFVLYPAILLVYLFYASKLSVRKLLRKYLIVYLFIILVMSAWVIRNYAVYKKFIPLTTLSGLGIWLGNNYAANGGWANPDDFMGKVYGMKNISDYERNRIWLRKGIQELKSSPKRIPMLFIKKILVHWAPFEERFKIFNPYYAIILLFATLGMLFFRNRTILENIVIIAFFSSTWEAIITYGDPRYRYPYEPYLIIFAAVAINNIFIIIHRKVPGYGK